MHLIATPSLLRLLWKISFLLYIQEPCAIDFQEFRSKNDVISNVVSQLGAGFVYGIVLIVDGMYEL